MPIISKLRASETVESVSKKIELRVFERIKSNLIRVGVEKFPEKIALLALKEEKKLEVYVYQNDSLIFLKSYPFTAFSGKLGPKLKEGDKQIPEGIYHIEYLNPNSSYYLSMKVSFPNKFDLSKSIFKNKVELGTDIFIHGKSSTIGCIPIGDEAIEELFILAKYALNKKIKVVISPRDFRIKNEFPDIKVIDWENELYNHILDELMLFPLTKKAN